MNDELITEEQIKIAKRSKAEAERILNLAQIAKAEQERIKSEERKAQSKQERAELKIQYELREQAEKLKKVEAEKVRVKRVLDARKIGITDAERKRVLDELQVKLDALQDELRIKQSTFGAKSIAKSVSEIKAEIARVRYEMETVHLYIEERGTLDFEIMIEFKTNSAPHPEFIHLRYDDKGELVIWNESQSWQRGSVEVDELGLPTKVYLGGIIAPSYYWKVNLNKTLPNSIIRLIVDQYSIEARNQLKCQLEEAKTNYNIQLEILKAKSDQDKADFSNQYIEFQKSIATQFELKNTEYEAQIAEYEATIQKMRSEYSKTIANLKTEIAESEEKLASTFGNRLKRIFS